MYDRRATLVPMFDVASLTRDFQSEFVLFDRRPVAGEVLTNKATPGNLRRFLAKLQVLTAALVAKRETLSDWAPDAAIFAWDNDLVRWRGRLAAYIDACDAAPADDRQAVLWTVTAPLLLGFYGGPASKLPQQPIDAVTPFMLANELAVDEAWRDERWRLFQEDLKVDAKGFAATILFALLALGLIFAPRR